MEKRSLIELIDKTLSKTGFIRNKYAWYKQISGDISCLDLQKSNYGQSFYINLCSSPKEVDTDGRPFPKEKDFPIRIRMDVAIPSIGLDVERTLNLENDISEEDRAAKLADMLNKYAVPFLHEITGLRNIQNSLVLGRLKNGLVLRSVREAADSVI